MKLVTTALLLASLAYPSAVCADSPQIGFDTQGGVLTSGAIKLNSEELLIPQPSHAYPADLDCKVATNIDPLVATKIDPPIVSF